MISNADGHIEDKGDAPMYEGSLHHLTQFTQAAVDYAHRTMKKAREFPLSDEASLVIECALDNGHDGKPGAVSYLLNIIDSRGAGNINFNNNKLTEFVEESLASGYDNGELND